MCIYIYIYAITSLAPLADQPEPQLPAGQAKLFAAWSGTGHMLLLRGRQVLRCTEERQCVLEIREWTKGQKRFGQLEGEGIASNSIEY